MNKSINIIHDPLSGEKIYEYLHASGARVLALDTDTSLSAAAVSLPFGGGISEIELEGFRYVPAFPGSAHFAEHMIFTGGGGGGRLERFCALGADANAETSMTGTTYYVTAGDKFLYALGDLASMVLKPVFARGELEKEREIILREKSDDDDIFTKGRNALVCLMFKKGSVRREIIGDRKSINKMNAELLRGIYNYAYRPGVMSFASVSGIGHSQVFGMLDAALLGTGGAGTPRFKILKSQLRTDGDNLKEIRAAGDARMLFCGIAPDMSSLSGNYARMQVYSSMLESMLFDRTEYVASSFKERGHGIHGSFRSDAEIFCGDLVLSASLSCDEPKEAARLFSSVFEEAREMRAERAFLYPEAKRRSLIADYLSVFDSPSDLALTLAEYSAAGANFTDVATELMNFDAKDFFAFADRAIKDARVYFVAAG